MAEAAEDRVVLLVDDDVDTLFLLRLSLQKAGFYNRVEEVHNGQDAIDYLLGERKFSDRFRFPLPDVIFLDLKMPGMNGLEFLRWLRTWPPGQVMPVIVLTSSVLTADFIQAYHAGANSFMIKGDDAHDLIVQMKALGGIWLTPKTGLPGPDTLPWQVQTNPLQTNQGGLSSFPRPQV
jgi:CheY-like chemotaxis protein